MKKLILILSLIFCLAIAAPVLAFEKVDVSGTGFDTDVIFRAKIVTFLEQLNFTSLAITDALNNGRQIHWQFTATAIEAGEQLTGIQLRSNWGGTADAPAAGIVGIEIKARADSESITHTLGQARAIVANVDVKKATFTVAHVFEGQVDVSSGGEITTLKNFRASLNNSGTIGTSYAFIVETANTSLNWDYGLYIGDGQADVGIYIGNVVTGMDFAGTLSTGIDFSDATFVPDSNRTDIAIEVGARGEANELDVNFAQADDQNFDPIQLNVNVTATGTGPTNSSTVNLIYANITHDTNDMEYLRLKCSDWNVVVKKDVKDVYVYQGEINYNASDIVVSGESAVLGLVMNAGSQAVTGNLRGIIISMQGSGFPANGIGIELRSTATTLAEGIRIMGTPLITVGIAMGVQSTNNQGPVNAFFFPAPAGADIGPCVAGVDDGNGEGSIKILIGGDLKYLKYWTDATGG